MMFANLTVTIDYIVDIEKGDNAQTISQKTCVLWTSQFIILIVIYSPKSRLEVFLH